MLAVAALAAVPARAGEIKLAENGKALAKIVIAGQCDRAARFAADDLKWHLDEMTGADFEIVTDAEPSAGYEIRVGESARTAAKKSMFAPQEFLVDIGEKAIELVGLDRDDRNLRSYRYVYDAEKGLALSGAPGMYDDQGTLYAVYDFLEKTLGVVWADAPDCGTVVPKRPTLTVAAGRRKAKPFMAYRGGTFGQGDRYQPVLTMRDGACRKAYEKLAYLNDTDRKSRKTLFTLRHRAGGDNRPCNHSFYWFYDRFLDKGGKRFIAYHPEWFAKGYHGKPPQMCYTNPEFIEQTLVDIRAYFDNGGYTNTYFNVGSCGYTWGRDTYALEPMDNGSFCQCQRCTAEYEMDRPRNERHSTHWFKFVNKIARGIRKTHPGKKLTTLAYSSHMGLPTGVRLEDNVIVYFCLSCNRGPKHEGYRNQIGLLRSWHEAYPGSEFGLWLYNTFPLEHASNGGYKCFPGFFMTVAEEEYRIFRECNVRSGIFHCGFNGEVENYMQLEWMIDPGRGAEEMLDEYFSAFGAAKEPLKRFYRIVERRYTDLSLLPAKGKSLSGPQMSWQVRGDAATMAELERCMDEAEKAVADGPAAARKMTALWKQSVWLWMQDGYEAFETRSKAPQDEWTVKRVPDAGGDVSKVDWSKAEVRRQKFFKAGGGEVSEFFTCEVRSVYDSTHLYMELTDIGGDTSKLALSPHIAPYDTWEFMIAFQRGMPSRFYLTNAFGDCMAQSDGEVNFRRNVNAKESGDASYGMRYTTDRSQRDRWTNRYAFPLATMLMRPVVPGDTVYFNIARVMSPGYAKKAGPSGMPYGLHLFTLTSYSAVHTIDRAAALRFER